MGKFLTPLIVQQVEDNSEEGRGSWQLVSPLDYLADSGVRYVVPPGFITDFASVPRIPLIFDAFGDRANLAATLHDWLYCVDPVTKKHPVPDRETADALLREAAIAQGVPHWVAEALYQGVRVGGESHWAET